MKKTTNIYTTHKAEKSDPIEEEIIALGDEAVDMDDVMRMTACLDSTATTCANFCSKNLGTLAKPGNNAVKILQNIGNELMEDYSRNISDWTLLCIETAACRTLADVVKVQNSAVQRMSDHYANMSYKLFALLLPAKKP